MSIFDRLFVGKVIKDFGPLEEHSFGVGKFRKSALLAEKGGELKFALKQSGFAVFGGSVSYFELSIDSLSKLRDFIDDAERIAASRPSVPR